MHTALHVVAQGLLLQKASSAAPRGRRAASVSGFCMRMRTSSTVSVSARCMWRIVRIYCHTHTHTHVCVCVCVYDVVRIYRHQNIVSSEYICTAKYVCTSEHICKSKYINTCASEYRNMVLCRNAVSRVWAYACMLSCRGV